MSGEIKTIPFGTPQRIDQTLICGHDGTSIRTIRVDAQGNFATTIDLVADIEIDGTQVLNRGFTPASIGSNAIVTVGATQRIKLYKATISPSVDIAGEVFLSLGAIKIGTLQSPKAGGQYMLVSCFPDYEIGALDDDLTLTLPSATTVSLNISYEVI